jgi:hypothetical protein
MDKKALNKVLDGLADKNIRFQDLTKLLKDFGFSVRIKGDHHIYQNVPEHPLALLGG